MRVHAPPFVARDEQRGNGYTASTRYEIQSTHATLRRQRARPGTEHDPRDQERDDDDQQKHRRSQAGECCRGQLSAAGLRPVDVRACRDDSPSARPVAEEDPPHGVPRLAARATSGPHRRCDDGHDPLSGGRPRPQREATTAATRQSEQRPASTRREIEPSSRHEPVPRAHHDGHRVSTAAALRDSLLHPGSFVSLWPGAAQQSSPIAGFSVRAVPGSLRGRGANALLSSTAPHPRPLRLRPPGGP